MNLDYTAMAIGYALIFSLSALFILSLAVFVIWIIGKVLYRMTIFWRICWSVAHWKQVRAMMHSLPNNGNMIRNKAQYSEAEKADEKIRTRSEKL